MIVPLEFARRSGIQPTLNPNRQNSRDRPPNRHEIKLIGIRKTISVMNEDRPRMRGRRESKSRASSASAAKYAYSPRELGQDRRALVAG